MKIEYRKRGPAWAVVQRIFMRIKKHYLKNLKKGFAAKFIMPKKTQREPENLLRLE